MKRLAVIGSTGSIGQNTLRVVEHLPERFKIFALAASSSVDRLAEQVAAFRPAVVAGTFAQDWANGAAAGVPPALRALPELVAVADAAKRSTVAAAPARSQRRLCIDFPPFVRRREPVLWTAAPARSHAPEGVPLRR